MATITPPRPRPLNRIPVAWRELRRWNPTVLVLLIAVGWLVLYPLVEIVVMSLRTSQLGIVPATYGLDNWADMLRSNAARDALWNTISLSVTRQSISFAIAIPIAWLLASTDLPKKSKLEFGFWVAFFLPLLPVLGGWLLLIDGDRGLINRALMLLPFIDSPLLHAFSWWGIVIVHVFSGSTALKVMLLVPAFRNLNSAHFDAARMSGATSVKAFRSVTIPAIVPTISAVLLLGLIKGMESFEVELLLGRPAGVDVYSTVIFEQILLEPPAYGNAAVLSIMMLAVIAPLVIWQQRTANRATASISGRFESRTHFLGRWRWPAFFMVVGLLLLLTVIPAILAFVGSFQRLFGFTNIESPWTTKNWTTILTSDRFYEAAVNTMLIGVATAAVAMVLYTAIGYVTARIQNVGSRTLDFFTWLPASIPGIVIGLGVLVMILNTAVLRPFYGTYAVIVLVIILGRITVSVQILRANTLQIAPELEEASAVCGATRLATIRRIIAPLSAPVIALVGTLAFAAVLQQVSLVVLVSTRRIEPLSIYQLSFMRLGNWEMANTIGIVAVFAIAAVALLARWIASRWNLSARA